MVLEGGGLYPHLTVEGMIGLSLRVARTPREDVRARVDEIARLLDIPNILHRRPNELTSVDRALVAVARAASRRPGVLLFDEPLGMLDGAARRRVRDAITTVQREGDAALFYATARTDEGLTFGGQVAILHERRLEQCATAVDLYRRPANLRVAQYVGDPPMNTIHGTLKGEKDRVVFESSAVQVELPQAVWSSMRMPSHGAVVLGIRPEHMRLAQRGSAARVSGRVDTVEPLGSETIVRLAAAGSTIAVRLHPDILPRVGDASGPYE